MAAAVGRDAQNVSSALNDGNLELAADVERLNITRRQRLWSEDEEIVLDDLSRSGFKDSQIAGMLHRLAVDVTERKKALGL